MKQPCPPILRLESLSLQSPIVLAPLLREISSAVRAGDRIAVVGASGAGKTSLLRLLNFLNSPSSGAIYFDDRDYKTLNPIALRREMTLVLQESKLLGMTGRDAIAYPLKLRGMGSEEIAQRVNIWSGRLGIPGEWLERSEVQLSASQRQIIAIARGLAIEPRIVLLDEPTTALDRAQQKCLGDILARFRGEETAAIVATRRPDFAREFATRVWHLQGGELIRDSLVGNINWERLTESLQNTQTQISREWDEL
ncbi:ATP-binding cassette domain-containing protein [Lyngbya sp. CCY1209]|uniref:ABC transporter ATP-binding protein n=1 Tax=Lyngbya sp. CCY1209 TaxID=2886103 RepID=UPI002D2149C5|nr:ATP-binding cassette domain-containing protein [Lyngbya sp. CCY1209]MEB3886521.1 ATP-binding cassette domain-containing protein [Lyngbya sp. CCY1209]